MPPEAGQIRDQQRQTWDRFSAGWGKWDHLVLRMLAAVGEEMVHELQVAADAHHLDVASGTGEPGLTIAAAAPQGRVVLTDLARGMLDFAEQNAARRGIRNVEVRECSADDLPFADATFDSISCRFGFMFFPDIPAAVNELKRVLRPGGKLCTAVWAEPEGNPWATVPMAAIATEIKLPPPSLDTPGLFRCATPGAIGGIFEAAGLRNVAETDVRSVLISASVEEYWQYVTEVVAPVVAGLSLLDAAARDRITAIVIDKVAGFAIDGQPRLPLHARCIVGTK
jgi:ubiquinone/menaquinone biosynthesis C-methylase UbiE